MFAIIGAANLSFLPVYGGRRSDQATASLPLTAFIIGNTVLQFPIGWLADHLKSATRSWPAAAWIAACASVIPLSFDTWTFWPLSPLPAASAGIYIVSLADWRATSPATNW
jgi:hypothetical protein